MSNTPTPELIIVSAALTLMLTLGASADGQTGPDATVANDEIRVFFVWGVEGKNRLDTASASLTKDLVIDPPITVPFSLTQEEKLRILAWADSLAFFNLPAYIAPPDTSDLGCQRLPCSHYLLTIAATSRRHTASWSTCNCNPCEERDRALDLARLIEALVHSKDEYKRLPLPRGVYN